MASNTTPRRRPASGSVFCGSWRRTASRWWPRTCRFRPSAMWRSPATSFVGYRAPGSTDRLMVRGELHELQLVDRCLVRHRPYLRRLRPSAPPLRAGRSSRPRAVPALGDSVQARSAPCADNVQGVIPSSGHWVAEEAPEKLLAAKHYIDLTRLSGRVRSTRAKVTAVDLDTPKVRKEPGILFAEIAAP